MPKNYIGLNLTGTMNFNGSNSTIIYASDNNMMPNGDFTIEWYQYQTDSNLYPRIFAIGNNDSNNIHFGVSIESGIFYFWHGDPPTVPAISFGSVGSYKNKWVHFAVSRSGSDLRVFKDGIQLGSTVTNNTNFNNPPTDLTLGNEGGMVATQTAFGGWITNFRWIKDTALYTTNFSKPLSDLAIYDGNNTKLLLLALTNANVTVDSSNHAHVATASNITWDAFNNTMA